MPKKLDPMLRDLAVRPVREHQAEYPPTEAAFATTARQEGGGPHALAPVFHDGGRDRVGAVWSSAPVCGVTAGTTTGRLALPGCGSPGGDVGGGRARSGRLRDGGDVREDRDDSGTTYGVGPA